MGQKVHPKSFRLPVTGDYNSRWFSSRDYAKILRQDVTIRKYLKSKIAMTALSRIEIERSLQNVTITINTAKPGVVIGRGGQGIELLKKGIRHILMGQGSYNIKVNVQEIAKPDQDAQTIVGNIAEQIEKRLPFRRVIKQTVEQIMNGGAEGAKVMLAGRLNGAEIARTEMLARGALPLQTLRANIDYSRGEAHTTYGKIGIKVWIYKGQIFEKDKHSA
jgi:small subunit ribosomal protein S3